MMENQPGVPDTAQTVSRGATEPPMAAREGPPHGDGGAGGSAFPRTQGASRSHARSWILGLVLIAIGTAVVFTVRYFGYAGTHPSTDDAFVQGDTAIISAKVFGRVQRVLVKGYQHVRKGEELVELDPVDAEIAAQQAQAALETAQTRVRQAEAALLAQRHQAGAALAQAHAAQTAAAARLEQSQTAVVLEDQTVRESISIARAQLSAATAQVNSARSNVVKAYNDLVRARDLLAQGAIAAQQVDQAQAAYDAAVAQEQGSVDAVTLARASLAQAEAAQLRIPIRKLEVTAAIAQQAQADAGLEAARAGIDLIGQREAELAAARAGVTQAEAQLAAARQQLDYVFIFAPDDAIVGSDVPIQPGQVVHPGQTLLSLVFSSSKWAQANFKETQLGHVRVGQPASVRVDLLGRTYRGHVDRIGPATGAALSVLPAQNATGNFTKVVQRVPVRIALEDVSDDLQVGLSVEATVDTTPPRTLARDGGAGTR